MICFLHFTICAIASFLTGSWDFATFACDVVHSSGQNEDFSSCVGVLWIGSVGDQVTLVITHALNSPALSYHLHGD